MWGLHEPRAVASPDLFALTALAAHFALALRLRVTAWPEVTIPGYLVSQGYLLYRDIKFLQTPALMEAIGTAFSVAGVSAATVRFVAILGPLIAHATLLRTTRTWTISQRVMTSVFFVTIFYAWRGSAIWPSVATAALAIPMATALGRRRFVEAGLWIGAAILIKQTAAFVLVPAAVRLGAEGNWHSVRKLLGWAAVPYAATALAFASLGAGSEYLEWTLVVPFRLHGEITLPITLLTASTVAMAFLPALLEAAIEQPDDYEVSTGWFLLVALGLLFAAYPRFHSLELLACVPCLAVGAGRLLRRRLRWGFSWALVGTLTSSVAVAWMASERLDGRVVFWNDDPTVNRLVERLKELPPETRLVVDLWPCILPQTGLLPPGRIYAHLWLPVLSRFDRVGERMALAAEAPGTAIVGFGRRLDRETVGPYFIDRR